jgi:hypothetical protein
MEDNPMSLHDKKEKDKISDINDNTGLTAFEQFIEWCYINRKAVTIVLSVMLVHTLIFVGIFAGLRTGNSTDVLEPAHPPHHALQPMPDPVEEPAQINNDTTDSIEDNSEPSESDSTQSAAYDAGIQAGEILNDSIDAVVGFFQGLNEATGATVWAREQWDSGRERVSRWIEENSAADDIADDYTDLNEDDTEITDTD